PTSIPVPSRPNPFHSRHHVRGHGKVPTGGQVEVSSFGQVKVSTPCSSCRSGTAGPDGDGEGANQSPSPPGSSIEVCEGPHGHHFCLSTARVLPSGRRCVPHHPPHREESRGQVRSRPGGRATAAASRTSPQLRLGHRVGRRTGREVTCSDLG